MNAISLFQDLHARYFLNPSDEWFESMMSDYQRSTLPVGEDPAFLLNLLIQNLESIYVPTSEGVRIARWIYDKSRGFCRVRYRSIETYLDVCMAKPKDLVSAHNPEEVPIYVIDGLPGYGKSSIVQALERVLPQAGSSLAEGFPPQRVPTISAVWIRINKNFSLNSCAENLLSSLGIEMPRKHRRFDTLSKELYRALYRMGATVLIVDELQFASGKKSAIGALSHLLALRELGIPIFAFTNTDLVHQIDSAPCQISQRIGRIRETVQPMPRGGKDFLNVAAAQFALIPYGHMLDLENDILDIYDLTAGSPRAVARLIEIAAKNTIAEERPMTIGDIVNASRSRSFDAFSMQAKLLDSLLPIDTRKRAELSSKNDRHDPAALLRGQLDKQRLEEAASVALYGAWSVTEREVAHAASIKILREAGRLPSNVAGLGEAGKSRKKSVDVTEQVVSTYASQYLAKIKVEGDQKKKGDNKP